jgi:hypothetical protein
MHLFGRRDLSQAGQYGSVRRFVLGGGLSRCYLMFQRRHCGQRP